MPPDDRSGLPPNVERAVVTVGTFDGIHVGHRDLLARVVSRATDVGRPSLVVTFDPHPLDVVNPAAAPLLLTTLEEKLELLAGTAIDYVVVVPFTKTLARYGAEAFVREVLIDRCRLGELWIGYDHGLGRAREGDASTLRGLGERYGFPVEVVAAVGDSSGEPVSSTAIRRAVSYGELDVAAAALGRRYDVRGRVVTGDRRGRGLGFPTINVSLPSTRKLLPPQGVYAVRVQLPEGTFGGMMNLGGRPTFGDETQGLEVHLFDVTGQWYDAAARIEFVRRLREVIRFPDAAALVRQLAKDEQDARRALTEV